MKKLLFLVLSILPLLNYAQDFNQIMRQAQQAFDKGQIQKAKNLYIKATYLKQSPKAYLGAGNCYLILKQGDSALLYLKKAFLLDPKNPEINFKLGLTYFTSKADPQTALTYFKRAKQLAPDSSNYALYVALTYQAQGNLEQAFEIYQKIMKTDTANPYPYYFLSEYMYELDSLASAYSLINKAIAKNPKNYNFYLLKGSIEFKAHLYENALESAEKGLKFNPNSKKLLMLKAQALYQLQRYSEAIPILEKLLVKNMDDLNIYFYLGWSYYYTGQYNKAIDIATDALKKSKKLPEFYQLLAYSYIKIGDYTKAQKAADKILQIQPSQIAYNLKITAALLARTPKNVLTADHKFAKLNALNLDFIKTQLKDPKSNYYFPKLFEKFNKNPDRLSLDQYFMVYLGYALNHKINRVNPQNYISLYSQHKYQACISAARNAIKQYPFDQPAYLYLALSYKNIEDYQNFLKYLTVYQGILKAIASSGDGMTEISPFIITNKDDIYYVLSYAVADPKRALSFGMKSYLKNGQEYYKVTMQLRPKLQDVIYFLIFR